MSDEIERHVSAEYLCVKKMGSGAYGHVWKVIHKTSKKPFALKKIFDAFQHATDAQRTYRQMRVLYELRHENIVTLQRVIRSRNDKDLYLVFEIMEAQLHSAISDNILQQIHFKFITAQVLRALKYLHSAQLIHRDLKPSNILLNSDCKAKVCDFGLVRSLAKDSSSLVVLTQDVATRWYRAPEVLLGSRSYGTAADMWSLGCIVGQMIRGKPLFTGESTIDQIQKILTFTGVPSQEDIDSLDSENARHFLSTIKGVKVRTLKEWFPKGSDEAKHLVLSLLQFNPRKRLTALQALRHSFVQQFVSPKQQSSSVKSIKPDVNDNYKLQVRDYKQIIYQWIKEHYRQPEGLQTHTSVKPQLKLQRQQSNNSLKKYRMKKSQSLNEEKPQVTLQKSFSGLLKKEKPVTAVIKKHSSFLQKKENIKDGQFFQKEQRHNKIMGNNIVSDLIRRLEGRTPKSGSHLLPKSKLK